MTNIGRVSAAKRMIKELIKKAWSPFKALEKKLLSQLETSLRPEAGKLLALQIEEINLVQRHARSREICCYSIKDGKPYFDPTLQFPANASETNFATIEFTCSGFSEIWTAEFILVKGYFFSIVFNHSPEKIQHKSDIQINSIKIKHDPMKKRTDVTSPLVKAHQIRFTGWLQEWSNKFELQNIYAPLSKEEREQILDSMPQKLPLEYLEIIQQCEGFQIGDILVLGLSQIYDIVLQDATYYVLAIVNGRGIIGVQEHSTDGAVYYLKYSDNKPIKLREDFRKTIEMYMQSNLVLR